VSKAINTLQVVSKTRGKSDKRDKTTKDPTNCPQDAIKVVDDVSEYMDKDHIWDVEEQEQEEEEEALT